MNAQRDIEPAVRNGAFILQELGSDDEDDEAACSSENSHGQVTGAGPCGSQDKYTGAPETQEQEDDQVRAAMALSLLAPE